MPIDHASRRYRGALRLKVRSADPIGQSGDQTGPLPWRLPGWATALIAGLVTAGLGWLIVGLLVGLGWLTARAGDPPAVLGAVVQVWLLAHGGGLEIGGVRWTLTPLGITALLLLLVRAAASWLVRQEAADLPRPPTRGQLLRLPLLLVAGYVAAVGVVGLATGSPAQAGRAVLGALVLSAVGALWGAGRVAELRLFDTWPDWVRPIPGAAAAACWTMLIGGAAALTLSIVQHRERITAIAAGLGADGGSTALLVGAQLAYWPNFLIWAGSWVLGSGFTLGAGTVVSPPATNLGLVPSIPVLGALPTEGAGHWALAWLATGVVAGILAGVVVLRRRPGARLEEATGVSGLAGVVAVAAYALLGVVSSGDLGTARLTGLGPRLAELLLFGGALIVLPAVVVGLLGGLVRVVRRGRRSTAAEHEDTDLEDTETDIDDEPTVVRIRGVDEAEETIRVGDRVDP